MSQEHKKNLFLGVVAGVAGGLGAAWAMNTFSTGPGQKLQQAVTSEEEKQAQQAQQQQQKQSGEPKEDATMKAAGAIAEPVSGEPLSHEQKEKGGPIVHYAFGALMGGIYGALAEYSCLVRLGFGTGFGTVLFLGADVLAVPALHLSPPATEQSASSLASPFAAHLVYGATTELGRRLVRKIV